MLIEGVNSICGKEIYLFFNEEHHKYSDNLNNVYTSCTTLLHKYNKPFDSKYWARRKAAEEGTSVKAIEQKWATITDVACKRGSEKHDRLERGVKGTSKFQNAIKYLTAPDMGTRMFTISDIVTFYDGNNPLGEIDIETFRATIGYRYPVIQHTIEFYATKGYRFYAEVGVFWFNMQVSGMIDLLAINLTTKDFVIIDWKTNKDGLKFSNGYFKKDKEGLVTNNWIHKGECMLPPVSHLEDCNGSTYTLQLSMYATWVEQYGFKCKGIILIHIVDQFILNKYGKPLKGKDGMYTIDDSKDEVVTRFIRPFWKDECLCILDDHYKKLTTPKVQTNIFDDEEL